MEQKGLLSTWAPCFIIISLGLFVKTHSFIHADNIYFLHACRLLLAGKTYTQGFLEPNPPLILLLYMPVIALHGLLSTNIIYVFYVYISLLASLSLMLCYQLISFIFTEKKQIKHTIYVITFIFFFFPSITFGQREHLLVLFSLPYLFAAVLRLENRHIPISLAGITGVLAGLGFCLKPYFLVLPFVMESYLIIKKRRLSIWMRTEFICILIVGLSYLMIVIHFFPDYLHVVVPLIQKYYPMLKLKLIALDADPMYILFILGCGLILMKNNPYPTMMHVFMLALISLLFSYFLSRIVEFYHALPALSIAIMVSFFCFSQIASRLFLKTPNISSVASHILLWAIILIMTCFVIPLERISSLSIYIVTLRFFLFVMAMISITLVYRSLPIIFQEESLRFFMTMALILSLFFSATPFGQYTQLTVIAILPYLFGLIQHLEQKPCSPLRTLGNSIFMGAGFLIDPHLGLLFILLESCFYIFEKKIRIKEIIMTSFFYGLFLILSHARMAIFLKKYYLFSIASLPLKGDAHFEMINHYFSIFALILAFLQTKITRLSKANVILCVGLSFFILSHFFFPSQNYFSTLPSLCLANLLLTLIAIESVLKKHFFIAHHYFFIGAGKTILILLVAITLFRYPLKLTIDHTIRSMLEKKNSVLHSLIHFFEDIPQGTYDFFSEEDTSMLVDSYTNVHFVGQYPMFWWAPMLEKKLHEKSFSQMARQDEAFFIKSLANNLNNNKPQFMIVKLKKNYVCQYKINSPLNAINKIATAISSFECKETINRDHGYIKLFSKYPEFRDAWSHYTYLTTIDKNFEIYRRTT